MSHNYMSATMKPILCRRSLLLAGGKGLIAGALAQTLWTESLFANSLTADLEPWIETLYAAAENLRKGYISQASWLAKMDRLYGEVDLPALLANIDFDRLRDELNPNPSSEIFVGAQFRGEDTDEMERIPQPGKLNLINKIAHVKKGKCIPPHGHSNMVSAFLVVSGNFRARQFDCLKYDEMAQKMWVLPSLDAVQSRGQWTSISDDRSNAHWLEALSDDTFLFSTKLSYLQPNKITRGRIPFDSHKARDIGRGVLEVPVISGDEADRIYNS